MNRLKELRTKKHLTLEELGEQLGMPNSTLSQYILIQYETGEREPIMETWQKLANFFDVSVPYLQGATTYEALDPAEKGIYGYVTEAMDRAFNDCALLPVQKERVLKAIAYSIDDGEFN